MNNAANTAATGMGDAELRLVWQPISTAPRDGTGIIALLPDSDFPVGVRYRDGGWHVAWDMYRLGEFDQPLKWMPIPDQDASQPRPDTGRAKVWPSPEFEDWFAGIEAGDGTIPVPQSIADGDAWHAHIGRRQIALGAWQAALAAQPAPVVGGDARLEELAYVPGAWRCPKCKLRLIAKTLHVQDGGMSANNEPQACANGCGPMWRVTEREDRQDAQRFANEQSDKLNALLSARPGGEGENHKLDTDSHVFFYEQDFYVLSNFSAFSLVWDGWRFDTSEAAYHYEKFKFHAPDICDMVRTAPSAHEAFKISERNKHLRNPDWDNVKLPVMRAILRAKADQHEYVRRKLLSTGNRILVEDSWRDDYWGWGPNRDGQNILGKLWMEVRESIAHPAQAGGGRE